MSGGPKVTPWKSNSWKQLKFPGLVTAERCDLKATLEPITAGHLPWSLRPTWPPRGSELPLYPFLGGCTRGPWTAGTAWAELSQGQTWQRVDTWPLLRAQTSWQEFCGLSQSQGHHRLGQEPLSSLDPCPLPSHSPGTRGPGLARRGRSPPSPFLPRDPRAVVLGIQMRIFRGAEP